MYIYIYMSLAAGVHYSFCQQETTRVSSQRQLPRKRMSKIKRYATIIASHAYAGVPMIFCTYVTVATLWGCSRVPPNSTTPPVTGTAMTVLSSAFFACRSL